MTFKILILRQLTPKAQQKVDRLDKLKYAIIQHNHLDSTFSRDEILGKVKDCDAIMVLGHEPVNQELLMVARKLKVVSTATVGVDHIDLEECKKRGIVVCNTPGVLDDCVADLTLGLILATTRKFHTATKALKDGEWRCPIGNPMAFAGIQITGKVVGLLGLGRIGLAITERLRGFKLKSIIYHCRTPKPNSGFEYVSFHDLLQQSDILVICCSLTPETRGIIGKQEFEMMKNSSVIINIGRGPIIVQEELVEALESNEIALAGLDVMEQEPIDPNHPLVTKLAHKCLLLPHIGSATVETREAMCNMALDKMIAALEATIQI